MHNKQKEFTALLLSHKDIVWSVGNRYFHNDCDLDDLFQDVALSAWGSFHLFRGECKFSSWLHRIAVRKTIDKIRHLSVRIKAVAIENYLYEIVDKSSPELTFELKDWKDYFMSQLSDSELQFVMLYAEGRSYNEMENVLGVNQNHLRVRMNRIKQRLKKYNQ